MKTMRFFVGCLMVVAFIVSGGCGPDSKTSTQTGITSAGGTFTVKDTNGADTAKIVAPVGAVPAGQTVYVTFSSDSTTPIAVPPGAIAPTKSYLLSKNMVGTFLLPLEITIPYEPTADPNDVPGVFWLDESVKPTDPGYPKYVAATIKNVDPVAKTITFTTIHFSRFITFSYNINPGTTSINTGFVPADDSFFHPNLTTGDASLGMSDFAIYYFANKKSSDTNNLYPTGVKGLYHKYREGDPNLYQDDTTARTLISKAQSAASVVWNALAYLASTLDQKQTGLTLLCTMNVTQSPQSLVMKSKDGTGKVVFSHVVVVFAYSSGTFSVYDPNFPGEVCTLKWDITNGFNSYSKQPAYSYTFNDFSYEGILGVAESAQFDTLYQDAENSFTGTNYATINVTTPQFDSTGTYKYTVTDPNNVSIPVSGTVTGGNPAPPYLMWSLNGGQKSLIQLGGGSFSFTITNPTQTINTLVLEATSDPNDPWKTASIKVLTIKLVGQNVTFLTNGGFEAGTTTGWTVETHLFYQASYDFNGSPDPTASNYNPYYGRILSVNNPGSVNPGKSAIVTNGFDPLVLSYSNSLSMVQFGTYALRVNNSDNMYHASSASQTGTIPSNVSAPQLTFAWAAVLEDPQHPYYDQPYVDIVVKDLDADTILYEKHFFTNDPRYSGWIPLGTYGDWKMIPWQTAVVDVSQSKGHQVKITITAADCNQGGHGGYAYIDMEE